MLKVSIASDCAVAVAVQVHPDEEEGYSGSRRWCLIYYCYW